MIEEEQPLSGGNVTGVVRIGQRVHRATGPWSPAIHSLLRHLEAQGFTGAPRFLGLDQQGREMLTFIEGEVKHPLPEALWSEEALQAVARFLRGYHDATVGYQPPADALWQCEYPDRSRHEVICHNDAAPYNLIYRDGQPAALIDFDNAGPGPRLWDIAFAAYHFVPVVYTGKDALRQRLGLLTPSRQAQRLRLFCAAYGTEAVQEVLALVKPRLEAMCDMLLQRAAAGQIAFQRMIEEGHLAYYRAELAAYERTYQAIARHL